MLIRLRAFMAAIVLGAVVAGCGVNTIPTLDEQVKSRWSEVQNQYQRRAELIPNLVETVKGFAAQERETLTAVVEARAKATSVNVSVDQLDDPELMKRFQEAQSQLSGALGRLIAVSENYPNLKSDATFNRLIDELSGTENRIAVERMRYNERVQEYNTLRRRFPSNVTAKVFGFKEYPYFEAPAAAQQLPKVNFGR